MANYTDKYTQEQIDNCDKLLTELIIQFSVDGITSLANLTLQIHTELQSTPLERVYKAVGYEATAFYSLSGIIQILDASVDFKNAKNREDVSGMNAARGRALAGMFEIAGAITSLSDITKGFSTLFFVGADCLNFGLNVVETRIAQLEYYDMLVSGCLDDDVCDASMLNEASLHIYHQYQPTLSHFEPPQQTEEAEP